MPRLSVDIDLTYLPLESRPISLAAITAALSRIAQRISTILRNTTVDELKDAQGNVLKLMVLRQGVKIKIEVSPVMRGSLLTPVTMGINPQVESQFSYASMPVLDWHELYAGKLCAALNRQHPRDLYDVSILLEHEGITDKLMNVFMVYLISGNRPIAEMLSPHPVSLAAAYNKQFTGMTVKETTLQKLEETRKTLIQQINDKLTDKQKQFLLSFKAMQPEWQLLDAGDASHLPAVQWKLLNIKNMSVKKHKLAMEKLEEVLGGTYLSS
ncbi:MAG: nucleotidyl transferase AbiEii/AbiGii toxin family protein [Gammaproteobacteria bacterium]|nr:nucleotidyl transferase AbiEii/AbiGii toxin family protein [Gammaproteobacteria bacterium]